MIVLINVVRLFGRTALPYELGDAYAVVSSTNWDYAATAAVAGMLALIFQEPLVNEGSLVCEELERNGEPCRWVIPAGSPLS